jgi:hypothetical protein
MTKVILVIVILLIAVPAQSAPFDCERFLQYSQWTTPLPLNNKPLSLEKALGLAAKMMAAEEGPFASDITTRLRDTEVLSRSPAFFARLFLPKRHVVYTRKVWPQDRNDQLSVLLESIRVAFSQGTVNRSRWRQADPQERFQLILHFKANAVLALFYQNRLYRSFTAALDPSESLDLPSEKDLSPRQKFIPLKIFSSDTGDSLFNEVTLTQELESRLHDLAKSGPVQERAYLGRYTEKVYLAHVDSVYSTGEGIFPVRPATAATLIGTGAALTTLLNWLLAPDLEVPPGPYMAPPEIRQGPKPASVDRAIEELEEQAKQRPLSEEEQIILDGLRSKGHD